MSNGLYNKYRPTDLLAVKGNQEVVKKLKSKLETSSLSHTILFHGPRGCGKTSLARICAAAVGCDPYWDTKEHNCANDTGIDPIREILGLIRNKPMKGKARCWILDEVHRLTGQAQSALLKDLEEPPAYVYWFLCTTDPGKLLDTIRSRCAAGIYEVSPIDDVELKLHLMSIARSEGKRVLGSICKQIAQDSLGIPRDAIGILESIMDLEPEDMQSAALLAAQKQNAVIDLCQNLFKMASWTTIASIIKNLKDDPESARRAVMGYCRNTLLNKDHPLAFLILDEFERSPFFTSGQDGLVRACYAVWDSIKNSK